LNGRVKGIYQRTKISNASIRHDGELVVIPFPRAFVVVISINTQFNGIITPDIVIIAIRDNGVIHNTSGKIQSLSIPTHI